MALGWQEVEKSDTFFRLGSATSSWLAGQEIRAWTSTEAKPRGYGGFSRGCGPGVSSGRLSRCNQACYDLMGRRGGPPELRTLGFILTSGGGKGAMWEWSWGLEAWRQMCLRRWETLKGQLQESSHSPLTQTQSLGRTSLGIRCWGGAPRPPLHGFQVQLLLGKARTAACGKMGFRWVLVPAYSIRLLSQGAGKASGWEPLRIQCWETGSLWKILSWSLQDRAGNWRIQCSAGGLGKGWSPGPIKSWWRS